MEPDYEDDDDDDEKDFEGSPGVSPHLVRGLAAC
jgi:hypothetical protein